jgi:hypothetical protein
MIRALMGDRRLKTSETTSREDTMKSTTLLASVATLSAGLIISGVPRAEDWKPVGKLGWFAVGKSFELEKGHIYWVGEFSGTFFSDKGKGSLLDNASVKCPAYNDIDTVNKKNYYAGYCIMTDSDGDQAVAKWQGAGDTKTGPGTWDWTGGTGKYKDIKGRDMTFVGVTETNWPDGTASRYSTWNR